MQMTDIILLTIMSLVVMSAIWVVTSSNLVHSAVALLFTLFGIAGLYVFLFADFIAGTQVMIYVGGILVLIIFGVMLTNRIEGPEISSQSNNKILSFIVVGLFFVVQLFVIINTNWLEGNKIEPNETVRTIGIMLLNKYLLPFEIVSVLLLSALIGAALLSRKK
jgi:NADH-quinone oxidoreductase subunit J